MGARAGRLPLRRLVGWAGARAPGGLPAPAVAEAPVHHPHLRALPERHLLLAGEPPGRDAVGAGGAGGGTSCGDGGGARARAASVRAARQGVRRRRGGSSPHVARRRARDPGRRQGEAHAPATPSRRTAAAVAARPRGPLTGMVPGGCPAALLAAGRVCGLVLSVPRPAPRRRLGRTGDSSRSPRQGPASGASGHDAATRDARRLAVL